MTLKYNIAMPPVEVTPSVNATPSGDRNPPVHGKDPFLKASSPEGILHQLNLGSMQMHDGLFGRVYLTGTEPNSAEALKSAEENIQILIKTARHAFEEARDRNIILKKGETPIDTSVAQREINNNIRDIKKLALEAGLKVEVGYEILDTSETAPTAKQILSGYKGIEDRISKLREKMDLASKAVLAAGYIGEARQHFSDIKVQTDLLSTQQWDLDHRPPKDPISKIETLSDQIKRKLVAVRDLTGQKNVDYSVLEDKASQQRISEMQELVEAFSTRDREFIAAYVGRYSGKSSPPSGDHGQESPRVDPQGQEPGQVGQTPLQQRRRAQQAPGS